MDLVANLSVGPIAQRGDITCLAGAVVNLEVVQGMLRGSLWRGIRLDLCSLVAR